MIADIDVYDSSPRALCEKTKAVVISTEYRKAPEHKYPAAHDDTWAVYQWVLQNAAKYKGDPKKVAIVGESAGGNMAASICIMAKQKGVQMPVHQLLIYPVTDYSFETKSYHYHPVDAAGVFQNLLEISQLHRKHDVSDFDADPIWRRICFGNVLAKMRLCILAKPSSRNSWTGSTPSSFAVV
ncbi:hypothetical protein BH20VER3_BH20VER3_12960 [soil metagenome]